MSENDIVIGRMPSCSPGDRELISLIEAILRDLDPWPLKMEVMRLHKGPPEFRDKHAYQCFVRSHTLSAIPFFLEDLRDMSVEELTERVKKGVNQFCVRHINHLKESIDELEEWRKVLPETFYFPQREPGNE